MSASINRFAPGKPKEQTRIVVAMSGGVDSSTVAALMVEEGYEVVGITLQLYDHGQTLQKKGACCAGQDIEDARNVAETLNIPHYVLNYESLFRESVMEDFADSYMRGETPIPCVRCNQSVKFRDLLGTAKELGGDALVTGHYVRRVEGETGPELHHAIDADKDQTYFLFATTQEQLNFLHFPLGEMTKEETRNHAKRFGLAVAEKPDSQDICFVPNGSYTNVVSRLRPGALDAGDIVHIDGTVLGQHEGIIHYTRGQRRGLGISAPDPLYVIEVKPDTKQVIVGPETALYHTEFIIKEMNWLGTPIPEIGLKLDVRLRSSMEEAPATIYPHDKTANSARVVMHSPERAITPGQACVAYDGDRVLGGGWISHVGNNA